MRYNKIERNRYNTLNEWFNLVCFSDAELKKRLKVIASEIVGEIKSGFSTDSVLCWKRYNSDSDNFESDNVIGFFKYFDYGIDLKWCSHLFVFIGLLEDESLEDDSAFVDSSGIMQFDLSNNPYCEQIDYYIGTLDKEKKLKLYPSSIRIGNKFKYCSVYIKIREENLKNISERDIMLRLYHELQHIYDSAIEYSSTIEMNSDVVCGGVVSDLGSYKKDIDRLMRCTRRDEIEKEVMKMDYVMFSDLCAGYMLYYGNLSEMKARLINFREELERCSLSEMKKWRMSGHKSLDCEFLCGVSETFREYYVLWVVMDCASELIDSKIKLEFAQVDICKVYDSNVEHRDWSGKVYKTDFFDRENGCYSEWSFDGYCRLIADRIQICFIEKAIDMVDKFGNDSIFERYNLNYKIGYKKIYD